MVEGKKKSGILAQIFVAAIVALLVGGTAPWWWSEFFGDRKPNASTNDQLADLTPDELIQRQKRLEEELHRMREELRNNSQTVRSEPKLNVSGTWRGTQGISYIIHQSGNAITIQEINPIYGVAAVGQGVITQRDIEISYTTAAFTRGQARLRLSDDGRQIVGTFTDLTTGMQVPASLSR